MEAPLLALLDLECGYHDRMVLKDVNLSLAPGSLICLLGRNGSGKSTLLRTIVRLISPLSGSIEVEGKPIESLSFRDLALQIAYVPQDESCLFEFSALDIVLMGRMPHSERIFENRADHEIAKQAMRRTDCLDFADRPISELSGGERQRVLIARALAQHAQILLFDEPTAHLDPKHQLETCLLLRGLAAEGKAIIVAVHDLNWASALGGEAVLLHDGSVAIHAPVEQVLSSQVLESAYDTAFDRLNLGHSLKVFPRLEPAD